MNVGKILNHIKANYRGRVKSIENLGEGLALVTMANGRQLEATIENGEVKSRDVQYE